MYTYIYINMQFDIFSNVCCTLNAVNSFLLDNMFPLCKVSKNKEQEGKTAAKLPLFSLLHTYILFLLISVLPPTFSSDNFATSHLLSFTRLLKMQVEGIVESEQNLM